MKTCTKCEIEKDKSEFSKHFGHKDGLSSHCKKCRSEKSKEYYLEHKSEKNEYGKQYRLKNKDYDKNYYLENIEKIKKNRKQYYIENKEYFKEEFKKYREKNKEKIREYEKARQEKNAEEIRQYQKEYRENNKEKLLEQKKQYQKENKEKINEYKKAYEKERKRTDACFKLKQALRRRLNNAIHGNFKRGSAVRDLGCSIEEFKLYLENQFQSGMSWENYGNDWQIDHIIPFKDIDILDEEQLKLVLSYTNLRSIWCWANMARNYHPDNEIDFTSPTPNYIKN